jgi:ribosomal protein L6P/L9E
MPPPITALASLVGEVALTGIDKPQVGTDGAKLDHIRPSFIHLSQRDSQS